MLPTTKADTEKRKMLWELYGPSVRRFTPEPLSLQDLLFFVALSRLGASEDLSYIRPLETFAEPLTPGHIHDHDLVSYLHVSDIISPHPGSAISAFVWNADGTTDGSFYLDKVHWVVPEVGVRAASSVMLEKLQAALTIYSSEEIITQWMHIARDEVLENLELCMNDFQLYSFKSEEKTRQIIQECLKSFSAGQVFNMSYRAARNAAAQIRVHGNEFRASNSVPLLIMRHAETALAKGWDVNQSWRDRRAPRSEVSRLLSDVVLRMDDATLTRRPGQF